MSTPGWRYPFPKRLRIRPPATTHNPYNVLHADDSLVIRKTLKRRLEENRIFVVESVANGDEAWSHLGGVKKKMRRQRGDAEHVCRCSPDRYRNARDGRIPSLQTDKG